MSEELRPCFHQGAERDYIVCDRCLRQWNSEFDSLQAKLKELENWKTIAETFGESLKESEKECEELESSNAVYREALKKIADCERQNCLQHNHCPEGDSATKALATASINKSGKDK